MVTSKEASLYIEHRLGLGRHIEAFLRVAGSAELGRLLLHVFELGTLLARYVLGRKSRLDLLDVVLAFIGESRNGRGRKPGDGKESKPHGERSPHRLEGRMGGREHVRTVRWLNPGKRAGQWAWGQQTLTLFLDASASPGAWPASPAKVLRGFPACAITAADMAHASAQTLIPTGLLGAGLAGLGLLLRCP